MGIADKIREFFSEDESWKKKQPVQYGGKAYGAWIPGEDQRAAWPNAMCAKCRGIMLKKEMYWNRESDSWYHQECLKGLSEER